MPARFMLPKPKLDALPLGAHRLSVHGKALDENNDVLFALTDQELFSSCGVRIAFTSREGGVSQGPYASLNVGVNVADAPENVKANRKLLLEAMGAGDVPLVSMKQTHGTNIVSVTSGCNLSDVNSIAQGGCDAAVVQARSVAALVAVADCLPLIIVTPSKCFAVVHAGWRGAVAHIAAKACKQLEQLSGCDSATFNAYVGPHIRSECFEVGEDVADLFASEFGDGVITAFRHVSLSQAVSNDLINCGVLPEHICDAGICTVCNSDKYYSYRATSGQCGRQCACAVAMA